MTCLFYRKYLLTFPIWNRNGSEPRMRDLSLNTPAGNPKGKDSLKLFNLLSSIETDIRKSWPWITRFGGQIATKWRRPFFVTFYEDQLRVFRQIYFFFGSLIAPEMANSFVISKKFPFYAEIHYEFAVYKMHELWSTLRISGALWLKYRVGF